VLSFFPSCFSGNSLDHFSLGKAFVNHHSWGPGEKEVASDVRIPGQRASSFCLSRAARLLASNSNQKSLLLHSKKRHVAGPGLRTGLPIIADSRSGTRDYDLSDWLSLASQCSHWSLHWEFKPVNFFSEFQVPKGSTGGDKFLEYSINKELVNACIIIGIFACLIKESFYPWSHD
jgi:hypothetical protein